LYFSAYKAAAVYRAWLAHDGPQRTQAGLKAAPQDDEHKATSALEALEQELARNSQPAPTKEKSAKKAFLDVWSAELSFIGLALSGMLKNLKS
jgi:hypothetical protein